MNRTKQATGGYHPLLVFINKIRKEKAMTQQELADKVFVTVQAVNQYEAGKREIKADMLVSLLQALGYDFSIQETFQDRDIYALEWDVSYYFEYVNEYGMNCSDFSGAIELAKEPYETPVSHIHKEEYEQASKMLAELTAKGSVMASFFHCHLLQAPHHANL